MIEPAVTCSLVDILALYRLSSFIIHYRHSAFSIQDQSDGCLLNRTTGRCSGENRVIKNPSNETMEKARARGRLAILWTNRMTMALLENMPR